MNNNRSLNGPSTSSSWPARWQWYLWLIVHTQVYCLWENRVDLSIMLTWSRITLKLNCRSVDSIKKQYQCAGGAYNEHTCSTHKESCCTCSSVSLAAAVFLTCALLCVENYICFPLYTHQFKKSAICCFFNLHNESVLMPPIYCLGSQQNN